MIQIGGVCTTFWQEGIHLQKHRDRNGNGIAILSKSIGVRGRFDSPEFSQTPHESWMSTTSGQGRPRNKTLFDVLPTMVGHVHRGTARGAPGGREK